jgi:hypothetical protein
MGRRVLAMVAMARARLCHTAPNTHSRQRMSRILFTSLRTAVGSIYAEDFFGNQADIADERRMK